MTDKTKAQPSRLQIPAQDPPDEWKPVKEPDLGSIKGDHTTRMNLPPATPRRVRRSITPARLYREIEHATAMHGWLVVESSTIKDLLEAILQDVLRDALDD